ncbi:MAG: metallophosphoesterase [Fibrobacterales bacterium]
MVSSIIKSISIGLSVALLISCGMFEFTPYTVESSKSDMHNLTQREVAKIVAAKPKGEGVTIAVITDSHQYIDDLNKMVTFVNTLSEVDFVVVPGDFTKFGLLKEYEFFFDAIDKLTIPYVTTIGNHECVAEGIAVYEHTFGALDYSFTFEGYHFVLGNTNGWHFDNAPNFPWLDQVLSDSTLCGEDCKGQVLFSHVPPWKDQFTTEDEIKYVALMEEKEVLLSVHGHTHSFSDRVVYPESTTKYLVADDVTGGSVLLINVKDSAFTYHEVRF